MKKFTFTFMLMFALKCASAQFMIMGSGADDICLPYSNTLIVVNPLPGYTYQWNVWDYKCTGNNPIFLGFGPSLQVTATGEYWCQEFPPGGLYPLVSNTIRLRVLPGSLGSALLPAPQSANINCVGAATLCFANVFFSNWPGGTTTKWYRNDSLIGSTSGGLGMYNATLSGYYKYSITSACTTAFSDSIYVAIKPIVNTSKSNVTCYNASDGNASVSVNSGSVPYSVQWNTVPVQTTNTISNLSGGTYTCTVMDTNGCSVVNSFIVNEPQNLVSFSIPSHPNPIGSSTGSINMLVSGGRAPYTYLWSTGATTEDISSVPAGVYTVSISGSKGCAVINSTVLN